MAKHHLICKSKTLDVPIIVTSPTNDNSNLADLIDPTTTTSTQTTTPNKFKLDKGLSLDSHCMNSLSSSASSSVTNMTSSSSVSSSTSSIRQQFLQPPSVLSLSKAYNIAADFDFESKQANKTGDLIINHAEHSLELDRWNFSKLSLHNK